MKSFNHLSRNGLWLGLAVSLVAVGLSGCTSPKSVSGTVAEPPRLPERLALAPGDVIEVKFFYAPELNELQTIRPDGKVTLQLVGDVVADGKTPSELREELRKSYTPLIEKPEVVVMVRQLSGRAVIVGGAVRTPGRVAMPGRMTALQAVMEAGGADLTTANPHKVAVVRYAGKERSIQYVNLERALKGEESFYLEPMDIVYVPRSTVVNVNQWIEQHISKMVPQFGFTASQTSSDGRTTVGLDTSR